MNPITSFFAGGFGEVLKGVNGILDHFVANPEEKLKAQLQLSQMANDLQMKAMEADSALAVQQASVVIAEAKSESWLARNWRPILMLTFTFIIAWNYILIPILSAFTSRIQPAVIVPDMWQLLKLGITGYIVGRSAEKTVPAAIEAFKK